MDIIGWSKAGVIASIASGFFVLCAVIVALIPIIKDWVHRNKLSGFIMLQLSIEAGELQTSFDEKIECLENHGSVEITQRDKELRSNFERLFNQVHYLEKEEAENLYILLCMMRHAIGKSTILDFETVSELRFQVNKLNEGVVVKGLSKTFWSKWVSRRKHTPKRIIRRQEKQNGK